MEKYVYLVDKGAKLFDEGKYEESLKIYDEAIDIDPNRPEAYNNRGNSLIMLGRYNEAEKAFKKAIQLDETFIEPKLGLGKVFLDSGRYDDAITYYEDLIKTLIDPLAHFDLGYAYQQKGLSADAIREYKKAISLDRNLPKVYLNLGNEYILIGEYDNAIGVYNKLLELYPDNTAGHVGIGVAYRHSGDVEKAKKYYRKAIEIDKLNYNARYNLANILVDEKKYDKAEENFKQLIKIDPKRDDAYIMYASMLTVEQENYEEAIKILEEAIKQNLKEAIIFNNIGNAYYKVGRLNEAEESYKKAIELDPEYYTAYYNLGNFKTGYAFKSLDDAVNNFKKALEGKMFISEIHNNIAFAYFKSNDYKSAEEHYEKAIRHNPNYKKAKENLKLIQGQNNLVPKETQIIVCYLIGMIIGFISILVYIGKLSQKLYIQALVVLVGLFFAAAFINKINIFAVKNKLLGLELKLEFDKSGDDLIDGRVEYDYFASKSKPLGRNNIEQK